MFSCVFCFVASSQFKGESPGDLAAKRQGSFSCLVHASLTRDRYHCLGGFVDSAFGHDFLGLLWLTSTFFQTAFLY